MELFLYFFLQFRLYLLDISIYMAVILAYYYVLLHLLTVLWYLFFIFFNRAVLKTMSVTNVACIKGAVSPICNVLMNRQKNVLYVSVESLK